MPVPSIKTIFFRNPHLLWLTILIILVGGGSALLHLPRTEDPHMTMRHPLLITHLPGASAERVEALVTEKLERELQEIAEIKKIESSSQAEISFITIALADHITENTNEEIFTKIRDKVADAKRLLPANASEPEFDTIRSKGAFSVVYALVWQGQGQPPLNIIGRMAQELGDRLRNVSGTDFVKVFGAPREEFCVTVDPKQLAALNISSQQLAAILHKEDSKIPAGLVRSSQQTLSMEIQGEFDSLQRLRNIPVRHNEQGSMVLLGDIAEISKGWQEPPQEVALSMGQRCVYVAARMQHNTRIDLWIQKIDKEASNLQKHLGKNIHLNKIFDQSVYTNSRLGGLAQNLLAGCALVVLVIFVVMGWRLAIVVGMALPLTSAITLFALMISGGKLHQISIFGMIIAIGLLIDNAIVLSDEVTERIQRGASRLQAIDQAISHLFMPLMASTLTTILGFMPIFLLQGDIGDFVGSIATSVILALLASFFTAMFLISTLSAKIYHNYPRRHWWQVGVRSSWLLRLYQRFLHLTLRNWKISVTFAILCSLGGFFLGSTLPEQFFPWADRDQFAIRVWLPQQTSIQTTTDKVQEIRKVIEETGEIRSDHWLVGGSFPSIYYNLLMEKDNSPFYAQGVCYGKNNQQVARLVPRLQTLLDQNFPEAQIVVSSFGQGPPIEAPLMFRIIGPSIDKLQEYGQQARAILAQDPEIIHTQASMQGGRPKIWLQLNQYQAQRTGLGLTEISQQMHSNLEGQTGGSVLEQLEELPVRIRFHSDSQASLAAIISMNLVSSLPQSPRGFPLSALGESQIHPDISSVTRYNTQRCNIIKAYPHITSLPLEVNKRVSQKLQKLPLSEGYSIELGGNSEERSKAVSSLVTYLPILITLMIATVILSFNSVRLAVIITIVALLSIGFGLLSLWLANFPLGFNPILGMAGLIGIAINDTIVVLAALRANPDSSNNPQAIVSEVVNCTRHILSTTLTTIGGFLPLLLFTGGNFWPPLALVIIGGVAGATILSLVFTPCMYYGWHRVTAASDPK